MKVFLNGERRERKRERERERCWRGGEWRGHQQQEGEGERAVNPTRTALSNFLVPSKGPLQAVQSPLLAPFRWRKIRVQIFLVDSYHVSLRMQGCVQDGNDEKIYMGRDSLVNGIW